MPSCYLDPLDVPLVVELVLEPELAAPEVFVGDFAREDDFAAALAFAAFAAA